MSCNSALALQSLICSSLFPLQLKLSNHILQCDPVLLNLDLDMLQGHPEHCWEHRMKFLEVPASRDEAGTDLMFMPLSTFLAK